ncbi:MAG: helix-turn-helix transcriptional regulator [Lachnospiraceae bacterium]|nr:helix-turn-helix transcriptional regulator [Lachnospiraceae bacterium]
MKTLIKEMRIKHDMTQRRLAELTHVTTRTIISIEKEQYSPSLMLAYRMSIIFNTSIEELCCLKENLMKEDLGYETSK